jgi:hypothetical protein
MASPHVAGVAALILSQSKSLSPAQVTTEIDKAASTGKVGSAGTGSPNLLLYSELGPAPQQALAVSTSSLPNATIDTLYSATLQATGGTSPYTWSATGLPPGLGLATDGKITGTPTATGTYTLSVTVLDSGNASAIANVTLTVNPAKVFPGAFNKVSPGNRATGVPRTTLLTWSASTNATSYQVCLTTSSTCSSWTNVGDATSATASSLRGRTTYYWQVRALTADGTVLANGGTTWRFTTAR